MAKERFSLGYLKIITDRFELWSPKSLVIPAFLQHVLNPRVFPIFDRHVERARRFFRGLPCNFDSTDISSDNYAAYRDFWFELTGDSGIDLLNAEYFQITRVDDALWSIGKHLKFRARNGKKPSTSSKRRPTKQLDTEKPRIFNTSSPEFINRVFFYCQTLPQKESITRAAEDLGVKLPDSYLKYPASHIDRWRRQGYPK